MTDSSAEVRRRSLMRDEAGGHARVGYAELFFDLVFVFAITQLSHFLLAHLTPLGALQAAVQLLAVWWAWIFTTWATNWLDPDRAANRLMLAGVMLGGLVMASSIGSSFAERAPMFAGAYVAVQVGRSAFAAWAMRRASPVNSRGMVRITLWFAATAPLWLGGAIQPDPDLRLALWAAALAIEYAGTVVRFSVPGLGRSATAEWDISGPHMAERCALFVIICLGEGLLITGATFAGEPVTPASTSAFLAAFVSSFATWWVYFDVGAKRGAEHIETNASPARVAQVAFTWGHLPIVAGIVTMAVADELVLAHPAEPAHPEFVAVLGGGIALFLGGTMLFKRISSGNPWFPLSHIVGLALTALLVLWGLVAHPASVAMAWVAAAILVLVALWEWVSFHGGWIERLEASGLPGTAALAVWSRRRAGRIAARRGPDLL